MFDTKVINYHHKSKMTQSTKHQGEKVTATDRAVFQMSVFLIAESNTALS